MGSIIWYLIQNACYSQCTIIVSSLQTWACLGRDKQRCIHCKNCCREKCNHRCHVIEDTTPGDWYGILEMPGLFTESMCPTLRAPGDELPFEEGIISDGTRYKYIHTVGTVGQVEWKDLGGHSYSGIFNGGSVNGWARLSQAKEPSPPALDTAPGMGLKFLRDGIDSANLVAMYSVNGQEGWNFSRMTSQLILDLLGLSLSQLLL